MVPPPAPPPQGALAGSRRTVADGAVQSALPKGAQPGAIQQPEPHAAAPSVPIEAAKAVAPQGTLPEPSVSPPAPAATQAAPIKVDPAVLSALAGSPAPPGIAAQAAAPPHQAAPPSIPGPAAQLAPALVHIAAAPDGTQHVTVKLAPVELGELRVHIERPREGPVQVTVEATRPETLQLLRQDQPALHRALDQAGLPPDGRIVVLQQASPDAGSQRQATPSGAGSALTGEGGSSRNGGGQGWGGYGSGADEAPGERPRRRSAWLRAGINITA